MFFFTIMAARRRRNTNPILNFNTTATDMMVKSAFDNHKFLPKDRISELFKDDRAILSMLPDASELLIDFICRRARRVFLTALSSDLNASLLVSLLGCFKQRGLTDAYFPIDNIVENGSCRYMYEGGVCTHDDKLNAFHDMDDKNYDDWDLYHKVKCFCDRQWKFCAPVFNEKDFTRVFGEDFILPFIEMNYHGRGHFSTVHRAKLHVDHQEGLQRVRRTQGQLVVNCLI